MSRTWSFVNFAYWADPRTAPAEIQKAQPGDWVEFNGKLQRVRDVCCSNGLTINFDN